ncbi:MAG TPA: phosphate ABC transporter permease PstA, partial [Aestuariivirga sp.]
MSLQSQNISSLYARRLRFNTVAITVATTVTIIGLLWLANILVVLFWNGFTGLTPAVFTQMTPAPGSAGGLLNAIAGSIEMTGLGILLGAPVGILAGTYMSEYGRGTRLTQVVRFLNDILLSAPSIVIGLFVYELLVRPFGHFSGWAGALALALIAVPVIVRTTEDMLLLVPSPLREAAAALGATRATIIRVIVYRSAKEGLVTGVLLAFARISGETAPLLFTALNNQFWNVNLNKSVSSLPVVIFQFALSPYKDWQSLAWT